MVSQTFSHHRPLCSPFLLACPGVSAAPNTALLSNQVHAPKARQSSLLIDKHFKKASRPAAVSILALCSTRRWRRSRDGHVRARCAWTTVLSLRREHVCFSHPPSAVRGGRGLPRAHNRKKLRVSTYVAHVRVRKSLQSPNNSVVQ